MSNSFQTSDGVSYLARQTTDMAPVTVDTTIRLEYPLTILVLYIIIESGIVFNVFFNENTNCLYCTLYLDDKENEKILLNLTKNQLLLIDSYWKKGIPLVIYKDERYKTIINDFEGITFEAMLLADFLIKH